MKRQKIQRELMKLENLDKRDEIVIKKEETPAKTRATAMPKVCHITDFPSWKLTVLSESPLGASLILISSELFSLSSGFSRAVKQ